MSDITLNIRRGVVHCLIGENGAGKSTLGKIIAGVVRADSGSLEVFGERCDFRSPSEALAKGITAMAQEVALVPAMSVEANVLLGVESSTRGVVNQALQRTRIKELLNECGFDLDPKSIVRDLRISDQQKVEILKALARKAQLIVMDEPTASLGSEEARSLLSSIERLRDNGTTVVFISHHLDEVLAVADDISVLRNGRLVHSGPREGQSSESLVELMLGRPLAGSFPAMPPQLEPAAPPVIEVWELARAGVVEGVSLQVKAGEILGIAGLVGSGRTELVRMIAGADFPSSGSITLDGRALRLRSPRAALRHGIFMIPEDRKTQGLIMARSTMENITISALDRLAPLGWLRGALERAWSGRVAATTDVRTSSLRNAVSTLSGGNQQKVLFARALLCEPRVLIIDEPTKGVDIGAKFAIHQLLSDLAAAGMALIVVSSEHEEVMGLAHRLLVMQEGRVVAEFTGPDYSEDEVKRAVVVPAPNQKVGTPR